MGAAERRTLTAAISVACPLTLFVTAWWSAACLAMCHLVAIHERGIMLLALGGLCAGIALAAWKARTWAVRVYETNWLLTAPLFLVWSAMATALFMGLPIGNLALGAAAGFFIGRKARHEGAAPRESTHAAGRAGVFTAAVAGCIALPMGILAVLDVHTMQTLLSLVGCSRIADTWAGGTAVIAAAVPLVVPAQYLLTRWTAIKAYGLDAPSVENVA